LDLIGELGREKFGIPSASDRGGTETFATGRRYIPGRNLIFLSMAAVVAFRMNISDIVCGVSETEYSGYPDCTEKAVRAAESAINASMATGLSVHAPLMLLDKADIWTLADVLGGSSLVNLVIDDTHTCYAGLRNIEHLWGKGCGQCNACILRSKGYAEFEARKSLDAQGNQRDGKG
jgi:7-cyano-7-deazaguanine synthase